MKKYILFLCLFFLTSCNWYTGSRAYRENYKHLSKKFTSSAKDMGDYYVVFLVDARHLDYTSSKALTKTLTKQPNQSNVDSSIGHAWIYLHGIKDGQVVVFEGGHSGELGVLQPRYFDGVMNYIERGEPDPIKYLWKEMHDGFLQKGNGGHKPSFAAKVEISSEEFEKILDFVESYNYKNYSFTGNQCVSFINDIASLIDIHFENEQTVYVDQTLKMYGHKLRLWEDEKYSKVSFFSTDMLEKCLMGAVSDGRAECFLSNYLENDKEQGVAKKALNSIKFFPTRFKKWLKFIFL